MSLWVADMHNTFSRARREEGSTHCKTRLHVQIPYMYAPITPLTHCELEHPHTYKTMPAITATSWLFTAPIDLTL